MGIEWVCMRDSPDAARERDEECAAFEDWDRVALLRVERKKQRALQRAQKKKEKAERAILEAKRKEAKRAKKEDTQKHVQKKARRSQ